MARTRKGERTALARKVRANLAGYVKWLAAGSEDHARECLLMAERNLARLLILNDDCTGEADQ